MTVYEPEDFDDIWNPEEVKRNKAIEKLKKMRLKQKHDREQKSQDGTPTSLELEQWFYTEDENK